MTNVLMSQGMTFKRGKTGIMRKFQAPISLREKQRQERETLILDTAEGIFLEKGYHETSIDEIAALVGVAKGTIYLHFASKEDLVKAIARRNAETFMSEIEAAMADSPTPTEKIETLLNYMYTGFFREETRLLHSLINSPEMKHILLEDQQCGIQSFMDSIFKLITEIIEEGKTTGEFESSLPTPIMVGTFFGLLSPRSAERLGLAETFTPQELARYLTHIYFRGITVQQQ